MSIRTMNKTLLYIALLGIAVIVTLTFMGKQNPWEIATWSAMWFFIELWIAKYAEQYNKPTLTAAQNMAEKVELLVRKLSKKKGYKRKAKQALKVIEEAKTMEHPAEEQK